jgi:hypothetical protein
MRSVLALLLVLATSACGSSEMSLTEYVERLNAINAQGIEQYEALIASPQGGVIVAQPHQLSDYTPQDLQIALELLIEIADEVKEAADAIDPPEQVAEIHHLMFDPDFTFYEEALAIRAGTAADWEELSASPEMAAFRGAYAEDKQQCTDLQAQLDATAGRGEFADTPWIPQEMKEIVDAVLGCGYFPENPEDVYRLP